jgi:hypothetical protein
VASAEDIADRVADEIARWLDTRSTQIADAVMQSAYRPRVVEPTRAKAAAYFRRFLVNPDGTLNVAGRDFVINGGVNPLTGEQQKGYGAQGYEDIATSVAQAIEAERDQTFAAARAEAMAGLEGVTA